MAAHAFAVLQIGAYAILPLVAGDERGICVRRIHEYLTDKLRGLLVVKRLGDVRVHVEIVSAFLNLVLDAVQLSDHIGAGALAVRPVTAFVADRHQIILPAAVQQRSRMAAVDLLHGLVIRRVLRHGKFFERTHGTHRITLHGAVTFHRGQHLEHMQCILQLLLVALFGQALAQTVIAVDLQNVHVAASVRRKVGQDGVLVSRAVLILRQTCAIAEKKRGIALVKLLLNTGRIQIRVIHVDDAEVDPLLHVVHAGLERIRVHLAVQEILLPLAAFDRPQEHGVRHIAEILEAESRQIHLAVADFHAGFFDFRHQSFQLLKALRRLPAVLVKQRPVVAQRHDLEIIRD